MLVREPVRPLDRRHAATGPLTVMGDEQQVRITPEELAVFYVTQANNIYSGMRVLAGLVGDWRPISELADLALGWFKRVNVERMRRVARKVGLAPRF